MFKFKKSKLIILLALILCIGTGSTIFAANKSTDVNNETSTIGKVDRQDTVNSLGVMRTRTSLYTEYVITDKNKIKEELEKDNIIVPKGKSVKRIITVVPVLDTSKNIKTNYGQISYNEKDSEIQPLGTIWLGYIVKNVNDLGSLWYFPDEILHITTGGPGGTITQIISQGVEASFSVSVGVDTKVISGEVGFSVTGTFNISDSYTKELRPDETGMIKSWAYHNKKSYEVWSDYLIGADEYETTGYAWKPIGVRFRYYEM